MHFLSPSWNALTAVFLLTLHHAHAIELDITDNESIKRAASTVAHGMMTYYSGNQTGGIPGLLPGPYYWWEAGAMWGQLIEYAYYTGDTTYNNVTAEALLFQVGPNSDYMPPNQTKSLGNDDQCFWAFSAMSAAELNFPNPPAGQPQWLALVQAVFNEMSARWDLQTCGGGLRWQIYSFNAGWNYKNSISNGGFFQLAARLARYTNNQTYANWAEKAYDWIEKTPLIQLPQYAVNDGSDVGQNCTQADHTQWTYNYGTFIAGAAYMYNYTNGSDIWRTRLQGFLNGTDVFFPTQYGGDVMSEIACEPRLTCNIDQPSFKAYLARWMATATQLAPWTYEQIMPKLQKSAQAAATQCSGGADGTTCGSRWYQATYDGSLGCGQQMSALSIIQSTLIKQVAAPVAAHSGGTSKGDPNAGGTHVDSPDPLSANPVTTGDKAGAGILTAVVVILTIGGALWMVL